VSAVIDCSFSGNEFWMDSGFTPGSRIEVRDPTRGALVLQPRGETGQLQAKWNVLVQRG
jgi:hypothetical protein